MNEKVSTSESNREVFSNHFTVTDIDEFHITCQMHGLIPKRVGQSRTFSINGYDCFGSINGYYDHNGRFVNGSALYPLANVAGLEDIILVLETGYDMLSRYSGRITGINYKKEMFWHGISDYRQLDLVSLGFDQQSGICGDASKGTIPIELQHEIGKLWKSIFEMPELVVRKITGLPDGWYLDYQSEIDLLVSENNSQVEVGSHDSLHGIFRMEATKREEVQFDEDDIGGARVDLFSRMHPELVKDLPYDYFGNCHVITPSLASKIVGKPAELIAGGFLPGNGKSYRVLSRESL